MTGRKKRKKKLWLIPVCVAAAAALAVGFLVFRTVRPGEQAHALFDALRRLDDQNAQLVFAHCPNQDGLGLAVYNRLLRAAAFDVVRL